MYEYSLTFKPTAEHSNADAMSRLPLPTTLADPPEPMETVLLLEKLETSPVTADRIRTWSRTDRTLSRVIQFVQKGWPDLIDEDVLKPYWRRKLELTCQDSCLIWGNRVIIPDAGRAEVLQELHDTHPGESRMKRLARMFVWWPGLDREIELTVKKCPECQQNRSNPPVSPLLPWQWPSRPWSRIHIDFAGPFTSAEFKEFLQKNGVKHTTSAPYHPASNGLAERAVQIFRNGLKKSKDGTLQARIDRLLFNYRITPQTTTGVSPSELMFGRRLRSVLDLVKPDLQNRVEKEQLRQKMSHDKRAVERSMSVGDEVYVKNFIPGDSETWLPGRIIEKQGPRSFRVELLGDRQIWRRHIDHLRPRYVEDSATPNNADSTRSTLEYPPVPETTPPTVATPTETSTESVATPPTPSPRYPSRVRRPPDRY